MNLEIQKWLYDILVSIQSVHEFVGDVHEISLPTHTML